MKVSNPTSPLVSFWPRLDPHRQQSILWRSRERRPVVAAGRGSGKTELALRRLALMSRVRNGLFFFAGPTVNQAKRIAWKKLIGLIPPEVLAKPPNQSELIITSKYGTEIHVVGMDKPHRIEGVQWDGGVVDECSDQKPGAYEASIYPACTHKNAWIWRIGVPKRSGVGAREFKRAFDKGVTDVSSFNWPSSSVLSPEKILKAKQDLDEKTFNEQFGATWENAEGAIYYAFDEKANVRPCKYNPERRICVGSDFNVNPMSWTLSHIYEQPRVRETYGETFDIVRLRDTNTPATLDYLYNKYKDHTGGWTFYGDAASRARKTNAALTDYQLIEQDKRFDKPRLKRILYPLKNPMLKDRFAASNAMFCNALGERRWFVDPSCDSLIDDLVQRAYAPGTMEPDDGNLEMGHMADALDYLLYAEFSVGWDQETETPGVITR